MNAMAARALVLLLPGCALLTAAVFLALRTKALWSLLQLLGAVGIVFVAVAHLCEAFAIFSWMHWGLKHSAGHYLDLSCAILGFTLLPLGCLLYALQRRRARTV